MNIDKSKFIDTSDFLKRQSGRLVLEDGTVYPGFFFGHPGSVAGEVVFNTGMVGYPESLTDPSYHGQILVCAYPLIGNYGVPASDGGNGQLESRFESGRVQIRGLIVMNYSRDYSHWNAAKSLSDWLREHRIPALSGIDTRALTKKLRSKGTMLGKIELENEETAFYNPDLENLVANVSISEPLEYGSGDYRVALIDCGCKFHIIHSLLRRGLRVLRVPWDYDLSKEQIDAVMISNGPGDPKMCRQTIYHIRELLTREIPVFGICMGHQLLSLAAGANTYKLKYGHRSQNQPVIEAGTNRCLVTSQNHGFAVDNATLPPDWKPWFINLNDGTNEGIRHVSKPFMSVQFHPEATPGPVDAGFLFDEFREMLEK